MNEDRPRQTAPAGMRPARRQRHVVRDDHHLDRNALGTGDLRRKPEVQPVPGIVFDDKQYPRRACHGPNGIENGIGGGRGEDLSRYGGAEHAWPDIAAVGRFVP